MLNRLEEIVRAVCNKWDMELLEFNGEEYHIHLLISAHSAMELSKFINNLKTITSRIIRKEFSEHLIKFYWKPYFWTRAYFITTTGGTPIEVIKRYIEKQKRPEEWPNSSPSKSEIIKGEFLGWWVKIKGKK